MHTVLESLVLIDCFGLNSKLLQCMCSSHKMEFARTKKVAKRGVYNLCIKHKNTVLENVKSEKLLGVKIDNHLSWKAHIDDLASNLSKLIALFRQIKIYLPLQTRILFYKTFVQPRIDYCCTVWGQSPHTSIIYKLQKLILRLIYDKSRLSPSKSLFEQSKILPIKYRVMYRTVCLVYKSLNSMTPDYLTDMFKPLSTVSQQHTRSTTNMELWVPKYKLSMTRCGLKYSGAYFYNMLPPKIRSSSSFPAFKRRAHKVCLDMFINDS